MEALNNYWFSYAEEVLNLDYIDYNYELKKIKLFDVLKRKIEHKSN